MDVNGLVVFSSETIWLENETGLLFTVFNEAMDNYICILAHDIVIGSWMNVQVNYCYQFTNLKIGVLETCTGSKKFVLKTTKTSSYQEIDKHHIKEFKIDDYLKSLISIPVPCFASTTESCSEFNLISYEGLVTKIKENGVYELDNKILLYTIFNICSIHSKYIRTGSKVFVSNVHLLKNCEKRILLCCGLSSVRNISQDQLQGENTTDFHTSNVCLKYSLSIYDFLWLERLSTRLEMKFSTLVENDVSLIENSELINNIIELFLFQNEPSTMKKRSLVDEYFSNPHKCIPFSENRLPVNQDVLYISDIIHKAIESISWIQISNNWKISICNQDNPILIGILTLTTNGNFYINDTTGKLPVIITQDCANCPHEHDIIQGFGNGKNTVMVAISEYDLIFENIFCKSGAWHCSNFLRTSCCRLLHLTSLDNLYKRVPCDYCFYEKSAVSDNVNTKNSIKDLTKIDSMTINSSSKCHQRFLVLQKLQTQKNISASCSRLILVLPNKKDKRASIDNALVMRDNLNENSFNYYETDDDFEFANLLSKLNHLSIDNKPKLGCLSFKSSNLCNFLLPGHIYIDSKDNMKMLENSCDDAVLSFMMDSTDIEIIHDQNCLADYNLDEIESVEYISVKETLLNRKIPTGYIVQGIIIDKCYEDLNDKTKSNVTISLKISDVISNDTIPVYMPYIPENAFGMLPGSYLELFGFFCVRSQKGNLYLKASSSFGIEIKSNQQFQSTTRRNSMNDSNNGLQVILEKKLVESNYFLTPFRRMCFIVKIVSAEVFTVCAKCHRNFKECCSCPLFSKANIKVSALVDNGSQLILAACSGKTAREFLGLNEPEWKSIASYVEQNRNPLKFSEKMHPVQVSYLPIMNQVFYYYCTSKATFKRLYLENVYILNADIHLTEVPSVWCKYVIQHESRDIMSELYAKLKHIGENL